MSALVAKCACFNLAAKFSAGKFLSFLVMYLLLWYVSVAWIALDFSTNSSYAVFLTISFPFLYLAFLNQLE